MSAHTILEIAGIVLAVFLGLAFIAALLMLVVGIFLADPKLPGELTDPELKQDAPRRLDADGFVGAGEVGGVEHNIGYDSLEQRHHA